MNLLETLKELKSIKADASYTEKSRRVVLASPRSEPQSTRHIFIRIFETAGSLALALVIVFVIVGGFSGSRYLSPISFQGIDPMALHAEAQAIDMQINVASLSYTQISNDAESTAMTVQSVRLGSLAAAAIAASGTASTTTPVAGQGATSTASSTTSSGVSSSTASSTTFSINEALQQLEQ